jgi:hypothetical protein
VSHRRTTATIESLDTHPNSEEIRAILSRLPGMEDADLHLLADGWHNTTLLAEARRRALEPDSPLVVEVLGCFETVQALFADDIRGLEDYVTIDREVAAVALKGVRDAIAAAYAQPILSPTEYNALMRAWRSVYPTNHTVDPDLGTRADDVVSILEAIPRLSARCHDASAAGEYASILLAGAEIDEEIRCAARDEAWHAAVLTSRRRVWHLVRRSGTEGLDQYCRTCRERRRDEHTTRVVTLCVDAACGLLVAGALEDDIAEVLTAPVSCLIPLGRQASGS